MNLLLVCFSALIGCAVAAGTSENSKPTPQMIIEDGYPVEVHDVTTQDGYSLEMHRIPGPGQLVFIVHGLLGSSADWVMLGRGKALAYILADCGYDVWLGNVRGNTYSKNQTNMTFFEKRDYWNFSWHEMGYYDLPTMIDHALATTGQEKLFYIGFSQGTTAFYVMASTQPKYNEKIIAMFALAPIAYLRHVTNLFFKLVFVADYLPFFNLADGFEFLPSDESIAFLGRNACQDGALTQDVCANAFMVIFEVSREELNKTMLPTLLGHVPAGSSTRQILHGAQINHSDRFAQWDYGFLRNLVVYRSPYPPLYDLSKITAPVYSYSGAADALSAREDVDHLISGLGNPKTRTVVSDPNWRHVDFIYGMDARTEVYDLVINTMKTDYSK